MTPYVHMLNNWIGIVLQVNVNSINMWILSQMTLKKQKKYIARKNAILLALLQIQQVRKFFRTC